MTDWREHYDEARQIELELLDIATQRRLVSTDLVSRLDRALLHLRPALTERDLHDEEAARHAGKRVSANAYIEQLETALLAWWDDPDNPPTLAAELAERRRDEHVARSSHEPEHDTEQPNPPLWQQRTLRERGMCGKLTEGGKRICILPAEHEESR